MTESIQKTIPFQKAAEIYDVLPDTKEMERIISCYKDRLLRLCFLYLKDVSLAEDALQDTFLKVYKCYGAFRGEASEKTWITQIAMNVCKNYRKGFWFRRTASSEVLDTIPAVDDTEEIRDYRKVTEEVMNLPAKYREVVLLYYYQSIKTPEIARMLSMPESTVAVRLKRAREQLKKKLKGWYYDE